MSKSHFGKCALCGKECELTFEHIPPRAAFNNTPAKPVNMWAVVSDKDRYPWETDGLPYDNLQKGMGKYSLCKSCNNLTGTLYGDEYKEFAMRSLHVVTSEEAREHSIVEYKGVHPLRFVKQVLSMFCSTDPLNKSYDDLRRFVLDKDAAGLDKTKYRLTMYFTRRQIVKYTGMNLLANIQTNSYTWVSEITAYPMGFLLYLSPSETTKIDGFDITSFADCGYDQEASVFLPIEIKEVNNVFPADFRTKDEIIQQIEKSREWECLHLGKEGEIE